MEFDDFGEHEASVSSQDNTDPGQASTTKTTETTTVTQPASTRETSPANPAPATTTLKATTTATTQPIVSATTSAQSITTTTTSPTNPGTAPSPTATSPATVARTTPTASGTTLSAAIPPARMPGQDSPSQSTANPKTSPAASPTAQQQPGPTASSGSLGTTTAAKSVVTDPTSPPGTTGAVGTSSPTTEPQGKQPLDQDHKPNTTVSTTVTRTEPSESSKDCAVPPPQCPTKQPPPSSSSPAQGSIPSTSPGSTKTVTPLTGSLSPSTTPMSQHGSKDTVPDATTTTAPRAGEPDQSTQDAGPASAKPSSASQSPASAQPPAPGDQPDQAQSCTSGHPQPNISSSNELICKEQVQHTRPTIHLKEPRTCDEWMAASKNNSFYESFCSTAQQAFDASRDWCTVVLTSCERPSRHWAMRVVLHFPLDSGEVLVQLMEKKDRLEELGIINITSDKMVEDMTIKDEFSTPLIITIITLAGSLLLVAAIYGCHQRLSQKKDQNIHPDVPGFDDGHVALIFNQRLTEEMQTMENGYHDNPTLEVMETSSEMQEKKVNLNGELGDSWIVPLDTLMKEDLEEEEDTHL
ncbi:podocalyxin [Geospiza fortis]|uniref:Podocalyxin n=1 Tax=Geospiza fortis TaxID=48883 RepID=A0A8N5EYM5_GEOFO|nr:podocalyxin [Geospiza fortis]